MDRDAAREDWERWRRWDLLAMRAAPLAILAAGVLVAADGLEDFKTVAAGVLIAALRAGMFWAMWPVGDAAAEIGDFGPAGPAGAPGANAGAGA